MHGARAGRCSLDAALGRGTVDSHVLEDSVESFIQQWRDAAVEGVAYARFEGSPLLEVQLHGTLMQLFERTGPYAAPPGPIRLIVHAVASAWSLPATAAPNIAVIGPGRFSLVGHVERVQGNLMRVNVGFPMVVGMDPTDAATPRPNEGDTLVCDTLAPAHAFVLPRPNMQRIAISSDDQV